MDDVTFFKNFSDCPWYDSDDKCKGLKNTEDDACGIETYPFKFWLDAIKEEK